MIHSASEVSLTDPEVLLNIIEGAGLLNRWLSTIKSPGYKFAYFIQCFDKGVKIYSRRSIIYSHPMYSLQGVIVDLSL